MKFRPVIQRVSLPEAAGKSVAVLLAFLLGIYITGHFHEASSVTGALLACTSAIVVMEQQDAHHSLSKAGLRIVGTFIGAVIACLYLLLFRFSLPGMLISVFVLEIVCMILNIPDNTKMSTITLIAILLISLRSPDLPPLLNGLLRFIESAAGAGIGVGMAWLHDKYKRHKAREKNPAA